ncbi:diol dehydratase reactivase ATPase-like domain-containing protein [Nocardioides caldifontis]|uniref:diol dehydratase reactivase ATPase-like domain-containing protein n=1 Tax=Nocardioides caldifontis TaxID=2588938 RepID=UPI0011DF1EEB|nr:diol dehydratase reactivase ATPase-like domain-containing protein [Nocardioides caldifontis]
MSSGSGVVAGIDIGNSTTEVVLLRPGRGGGEVVAHSRSLTRGDKGSPESVEAAARLVQRLARNHDLRIRLAAVAPLRAVHTGCRTVHDPAPDTAPLHVLTARAPTAAGDAAAAGRPVPLDRLADERAGGDAVVVLAGEDQGYREVAERVTASLQAGVRVVGVLTARDEAVLVANRLRVAVPVIDQVPVARARSALLVAVEARPLGSPLTRTTDPFWLAATFSLDAASPAVRTVARSLEDSSYSVVALLPDGDVGPAATTATEAEQEHVHWGDGTATPLRHALPRLQAEPPGAVRALGTVAADDVYALHLDEAATAASSRRGTVRTDRVVTAVLRRDGAATDPATLLEELLDTEVRVAGSEAGAGRAGALSTPGAPADAVVVDLGGGTVDVSDGTERCVVAGAGEMLTRLTTEALGVPSGTAEHAKRGPALHVVAPQVVLDEKGTRTFLDSPAPASAAGTLCVHGPAGLVPFARTLGLGEWRAWRLAAKRLCLGRNVRRALAGLTTVPAGRDVALVLVGGAAGDDEVVAAVTEVLPAAATVGRGNVAGSLGHRCAVAFGLAAGGDRSA